MALDIYKESPIPKNLTFDEESLFWRLRLGEGIPSRAWHKPLERNKTWYEVKANLDKKLGAARANSIFHIIYPQGNLIRSWLNKFIKTLKISFLLKD